MTKQIRNFVVWGACAAATLTLPALAHGQAQTNDKRTFYTFSAAVEMPGTTLPAGEYLFRLMDPDTSRQVIQVLSKDGKEVYGSFFSMPIQAADASDKPEVRFMEAAAGAPPAIRAIWYPGERTGREFIYPREQALRIAKNAKEPVLTTASASSKADETNTADVSRVGANGQNVAAQADNNAGANANASGGSAQVNADSRAANDARTPASDNAATPVGTSGTTATANAPVRNEQGGSGTATTNRTPAAAERSNLPATASSTPLIALLGVAILGIATALRFRLASASNR